jgi:hypothetical protein
LDQEEVMAAKRKSKGVPEKFDRKVALWNEMTQAPKDLLDAAVYVNDTVELVKSAAEQNFGEDVDPLVVLEMYDRVHAEYLRRLTVKGVTGVDDDSEVEEG